MKKLVENFTSQLKEAMSIASAATLKKHNNISNVLVTGLGGSGIGGTILAELVADKCKVPVLVNKDYFLPAYVKADTLVIISSYSGNTEETVNAMKEALSRKAMVVAVTSGGKVLEMVKENGLDHIVIPGGQPPRSCIGYCLIQLIRIFIANGLADPSLMDDVQAAVQLLDKEEQAIRTKAEEIAGKMHHKFPVLYSLGTCEGTVVRFRQ